MKIVIVGPVYPYRGGIAQYTGLMAQSLAKEHEVITVSFKLQYPKLLYRNEQKDVTNDSFRAPDMRYWINTVNPFTWISTARKINALKPDLAILQWWHPFFAPTYWSILKLLNKRIRALFCCHNVLPHEGFPCKSLLAKLVLRQGDAFLVHSATDEKDLLRLVANPHCVKMPLLTFNAFRQRGLSQAESRALLGLAEDEEVMLFFGFIRKYKGLKQLLRAMPSILEERPKAHLLVVGEFFEGDKQDYLDLIKDSGIPESALTLVDGYLPDREVEPYFAACDLVVLPYESATQSAVVQTAYDFEKPVVATAVGGLPEVVVDGKTGYVIPPKDEIALANAVVRFFIEGNKEAFTAGIREEAYKYSWDRMNEMVTALYKEEK